MASGVDVQIDAKELVDAVGEFRIRGGKTKPAMGIVAEMLVSRVSDEFDTEGHGRWPGLAPSTLKKRRGSVAKILQNLGGFSGSIAPDSDEDSAEASTDKSYAVYHVSDKPRTKIPLRNPFDLWDMDDVADDASEIVLTYVAGASS